MARVSGAELVCRALEVEGVKHIFTLAGDHILPLLDSTADHDFRIIDTRNEQAAVHMANAWGRLTGTPGICTYTTPGFTNAIPGLANAAYSESPVVSIAGCADSLDLGRGAQQEIDQVGLAAPVTKMSVLVSDARRIPQVLAHALRVAFSGRRGPVHLTIPTDVQQQLVNEDEAPVYWPEEYRPSEAVLAPPSLIERAIAVLRQARRPLAIAGSAAAYGHFGKALQQFVETTRVPVLTDDQARGLIPDDHPQAFGIFERPINRCAALVSRADLVMLFGRKQDFTIGFCQPPAIAHDARIIQVDPSASEVARNRGVTVGIVGDVSSVLEQFTREAAQYTWPELPWLDEFSAVQAEQARWATELARAEVPMHALFVHKTLAAFLRPDDCLVFDGGDFCHFARLALPARQTRRWLYPSSLGLLGSAIPTALATKLAYPEVRVFAITGDGAFGFNAMEFDTAVRHRLNIIAIVGNDGAWGIDRHIQLGLYGRAVATDLLPSRYDVMVAGLGGHGALVERPDDLAPALQAAIASGRPALINVVVQRAISPRAEAAIARHRVADTNSHATHSGNVSFPVEAKKF